MNRGNRSAYPNFSFVFPAEWVGDNVMSSALTRHTKSGNTHTSRIEIFVANDTSWLFVHRNIITLFLRSRHSSSLSPVPTFAIVSN